MLTETQRHADSIKTGCLELGVLVRENDLELNVSLWGAGWRYGERMAAVDR